MCVFTKELPMLNAPLSSDSHVELAKVVAEELCKDSNANIVVDGEGFWRYNGKIWKQLDAKTVRKAVVAIDGHPIVRGLDPKSGEATYRSLKVTSSLMEGVVSVMAVMFGAGKEDFFKTAPFGLQFNNGFLTINDGGELVLKASSPKWRQRVLMEWDWEPKAYAPRWEEALEQWFQVNPDSEASTAFDANHDAMEKRMYLQEFAGACLMGFAPKFAKATILLGAGQNGKSKFIEAVQMAFPEGAWSTVEPQTLSNEYRAAQLAGKRINFAADIPSTEIVSSHIFKAAVTGDVIMARHIRQDPFSFKPEAGHLFSANALPGTRDHSAGFWRRFVVIEFANRFKGKQLDPHLGKKLQAEKPAIIAWMVRGAQRLLKNGRYSIPTSSLHQLNTWRKDSDVVALWLDDCTKDVMDAAEGTMPRDMWRSFDVWRNSSRYSPMGERTFYRRLKNLIGDPVRRSYGKRFLKQLL